MKTDRLYEELTTPERFALTLDAFARRDIVEIDRLQGTMAEQTYRMTDATYWRRLQMLNTLALTHGLRRKEIVARALSALAVAALTDDLDAEARNAATVGQCMGKIKAYDAAWRRFCDSLGIDADTALSGFQVDPHDSLDALFADVASIREGIEANLDEALRDELIAMYESLWERVE